MDIAFNLTWPVGWHLTITWLLDMIDKLKPILDIEFLIWHDRYELCLDFCELLLHFVHWSWGQTAELRDAAFHRGLSFFCWWLIYTSTDHYDVGNGNRLPNTTSRYLRRGNPRQWIGFNANSIIRNDCSLITDVLGFFHHIKVSFPQGTEIFGYRIIPP